MVFQTVERAMAWRVLDVGNRQSWALAAAGEHRGCSSILRNPSACCLEATWER